MGQPPINFNNNMNQGNRGGMMGHNQRGMMIQGGNGGGFMQPGDMGGPMQIEGGMEMRKMRRRSESSEDSRRDIRREREVKIKT